MIQEYVPGKQLALSHIIASPDHMVCQSLGLDDEVGDTLSILPITLSDAVISVADACH